MVPKKERVKMRLILGTHSPKGLEVFRDVQEKVEKQEMEMRHNLPDRVKTRAVAGMEVWVTMICRDPT